MSDELDSERISLEPESLAQEPQVEKKPRCRLQVQWPLGGDLFFDNIRSRAYVVLLLSFYIVSLFIETRNLNSFEIFWAGIALVPVTGIFLRPNDAVVSRLWSLVFIGAVAALNAWVLLNLRDLEDSNSVSFQFAIGIRIVITLVLDLSCILELVNLVFHTPYFFEYRQRVYLESSAERYPRIDFRRRASKEYIHGQKETQRSLKSRGGWHLLSNKPRFFDFLVIWVSNRVQLWSYCGNFRRKTDKLATTFSLWQTG